MLYLAVSHFISSVPSYPSSPLLAPFDSSKDPFFTLLIADLHHTQSNPERTVSNVIQLSNFTRKLNPAVLTIAGDLVDGLNSTCFLGWRREYEANWQRYNGTRYLSDIFGEGRIVLESAGNHDLYNVGADDDLRNRYRHYTMHANDTFGVRAHTFANHSVPVRVIVLNAQRPPTPSGPVGIFPGLHADALDALDEALRDDMPNVVVSHFPITHLWSVATAAGGAGAQAVLHRAHAFLSGHVHPLWTEVARKRGTLSVVATAFFQYPLGVVAWVDSGGAGAQVVDAREEGTIVVTYPLPKAQLTARSCFALRAFPVRVLSFSESPLYLPVYVDDRFVGVANHLRAIRRNVHFYSLDVAVANGSHALRVGPKEVAFFVGDASEATTEVANNLYSPEFAMIGPAAFLIYMGLFVVPWWGAMADALDNFRMVMFGNPTAVPIPWPQYVLLGPLYMLGRLRRAPAVLYYWCAFMAAAFAVLPIYTTFVDDEMAVAWYSGVQLGGTWSQYGILGVCVLIYEVAFALEIFHIVGILYENEEGQPLACGQLFEIVFLAVVIVIGVVGWGMIAYHAAQWWGVCTSTVSIVMVVSLCLVIGIGRK